VADDSIEFARPPLRASDADRQRVADVLREHTSAGRLTIEEFDQRVDAAYAARTVPELRRLLADLPVRIDDVLAPDVPAAPAQREYRPRPGWPRWAGLAASVAVLLGLVLLATRGYFVFWPLLLGGIFVFGGGRRGGRRHHHHH
jgi:hypothetical protein